MTLNVKDWGAFPLSEVFSRMEAGKVSQAYQLEEGHDVPYIGAKKENNGVMTWCTYNPELVSPGNCVVLICDGQGSVGYANYMESDFLGTVNLMLCYNEKHMNRFVGLFLVTIMSQERPKYSFGRKWKTHIGNTVIKLPKTEFGKPDWDFMEKYIKSLHYNSLQTTNTVNHECHTLCVNKWKEFHLGDLFLEMYKAKAHVKGELECYDVPADNTIRFVSRTEINNGCDCYVLNNNLSGIEKGNAISIGDTTATCFYQGEDFVCGDHIVICRADWINLYTALFIISILKQEKYKYSYGRAFKMELISNTILKLPATADNKPDFQFMENYIKSLPYGDIILKRR